MHEAVGRLSCHSVRRGSAIFCSRLVIRMEAFRGLRVSSSSYSRLYEPV